MMAARQGSNLNPALHHVVARGPKKYHDQPRRAYSISSVVRARYGAQARGRKPQ